MKVSIQDLKFELSDRRLWWTVSSFIQNYRHNKLPEEIDNSILEFANRDDIEVSLDPHYISLIKGDTQVDFWIANKFYAYGSNVNITPKNLKEEVRFHSCFPSRKLRMRMYAIESAYRYFMDDLNKKKGSGEQEAMISKAKSILERV